MRIGSLLALAALTAAAGCGLASVLNPDFLQAVGATATPASLPGEAPALVVEVENSTGHVVDFQYTYRNDESEVFSRFGALADGGKASDVLICPVQELTLGNVSDLNEIGVRVRLGAETVNDAFIEVEAFGVLLRDEINYDCGDVVTFNVTPSGDTRSGFRVFAFIRRSGAQSFTAEP
jgi:hypothetical protein